MTKIIEYQTTEVWGTSGNCNKCGYERLHVHETKRPGPVTVDEDGNGQFTLMVIYEWSCAGCSATGPLSNIAND